MLVLVLWKNECEVNYQVPVQYGHIVLIGYLVHKPVYTKFVAVVVVVASGEVVLGSSQLLVAQRAGHGGISIISDN